jgi:dual specificity tyrosine-phosphorylation-regulated kinase 1
MANVVQMASHFIHNNHQCIVFELLSFNLYDLLKTTRFKVCVCVGVCVCGWVVLIGRGEGLHTHTHTHTYTHTHTHTQGVSLALVSDFARQLLLTLHCLSARPNPVIHCDLKPENILLRKANKAYIKVGSNAVS